MTDEECASVQREVDEYLHNHRHFDIGNTDDFNHLVAEQRFGMRKCGREQDELRAVATMCVLGPDRAAGIPPPAMRRNLLALLRKQAVGDYVNVEHRILVDSAVAYGCGWERKLQGNGFDWRGIWPGAKDQLARRLEFSVWESDTWLRDRVVEYANAVDEDVREFDSLELARILASPVTPTQMAAGEQLRITCKGDYAVVKVAGEKLEPVRPGSKRVWTIDGRNVRLTVRPGQLRNEKHFVLQAGARLIVVEGDDDTLIRLISPDETTSSWKLALLEKAVIESNAAWTLISWECTCGTANCEHEHRLMNWDPKLSLRAFLANAVKGLNGPPQTGSFAQGAYYGLLSRDQAGRPRLRLARVEQKMCRQSHVPAGKTYYYEGSACPICNTVTRQKIVRELLILVDVDVSAVPAPYESSLRWRCQSRESRKTHCQVVTGAIPPARPGKQWDNYYDMDYEQDWMELVLARKLRDKPGYRKVVAKRLGVDVERLRRWASARIASLEPRFGADICPLCKAKHPENASRLWVRT